MPASIFCPIPVAIIATCAYIAGVMKQGANNTNHRAIRPEFFSIVYCSFVARYQARHGECYIKRMLLVVIDSVTAFIIEHLAIEQAVAGLSDKLRAVFVLARYRGMPYAEISTILEIPVGTVKSRMSLAERQLRTSLAPILQEEN